MSTRAPWVELRLLLVSVMVLGAAAGAHLPPLVVRLLAVVTAAEVVEGARCSSRKRLLATTRGPTCDRVSMEALWPAKRALWEPLRDIALAIMFAMVGEGIKLVNAGSKETASKCAEEVLNTGMHNVELAGCGYIEGLTAAGGEG